MFREFRSFVLRGNVVDLAVAVVIGAAFGAVVSQFVASFITPLIALVGGEQSYEQLSFEIGGTVFPYGRFLGALISFLIVAGVVFFLVIKPVNLLMERLLPAQPVDRPTRACPECLSDIPAAASRCSFCTATVAAQPE
jgi:large conductance mechanosensitive channel